jgi:hypothetical protein
MTLEQLKQRIAARIIDDLCGRSGGDHWFEGCDPEIQDEIRSAWADIIETEIEKAGVKVRVCTRCHTVFNTMHICERRPVEKGPRVVTGLMLLPEEE